MHISSGESKEVCEPCVLIEWQGDVYLFQHALLKWYAHNGRHGMKWRQTEDPYEIMVSEYMLQQTQVIRVTEKYEAFLDRFPTVQDLAYATIADVLRAWNGLGYNRRAVFLQRAAVSICEEFRGNVPHTPEMLQKLPGIGPNTAGAIAAFAYKYPSVFIETNIRAVFLHCMAPGRDQVKDDEILGYIEKTLYHADPRTWYYALMDYGAFLKRLYANPSRRSAHHTHQSVFYGSDRRLRGMVVRFLIANHRKTIDEIAAMLAESHEKTMHILHGLHADNMIFQDTDGMWQLWTKNA